VTVRGVMVAHVTVAGVVMHICLTRATMRNYSGYSY
jgi:hypothetical protein